MPDLSIDSLAILGLLRDRHNALVSGPTGTGKTRLLSEVAQAFEGIVPAGPVHVPGRSVAIPKTPPTIAELRAVLPSPDKTDRKVFRTVFHQNSKYRDFVTGLAPAVGSKVEGGGTTFRVTAGTLYRASQHALGTNGSALLIIDEINRGPAVQVFGGSIVAIESDKRLGVDGKSRPGTQYFEVMDPATGDLMQYALPHHLYILGAMNQADTSVEPLDVAFLRRWMPFLLTPSETVLRDYFRLPEKSTEHLPEVPTEAAHVYEASARAWKAVNDRLCLGRGPEFQVGHGVMMGRETAVTALGDALKDVAASWSLIRVHIDEVFFGDTRGIAAALNVGSSESHPYTLVDSSFAEEPRLQLVGPDVVTADGIYTLLRAVAE